jgi:hypothetical protein
LWHFFTSFDDELRRSREGGNPSLPAFRQLKENLDSRLRGNDVLPFVALYLIQ